MLSGRQWEVVTKRGSTVLYDFYFLEIVRLL